MSNTSQAPVSVAGIHEAVTMYRAKSKRWGDATHSVLVRLGFVHRKGRLAKQQASGKEEGV